MGAHGINGIDHLLIAVRDLDKARDGYARLGFTLTPRGRHSELKSINHTIMFAADDYVELLALEQSHPVTAGYAEFLKTREGLAALALKTDDARTAWGELAAAGLSGGEAVDFGRPVDLPEGRQEARFTITAVDRAATPGGCAFLCQHHSREVVWRPESVIHENGAQGLAAVLVAADDVDGVAGAYGRLFGSEPQAHETARVVATGSAPVVVATPASLRWMWGDDALLDQPPPLVAGFVVRVASRDSTQQVLQKSKIPTIGSEGIFRVGSLHTHGVLLAFAEGLDLGRLIPR